jgi:hypothetical protein
MTILVLSILRYMTPAMGLLMLLAALPLARAAERVRVRFITG